MKRIFVIACLFVLSGCLSQPKSRLLQTINFGVLKNSRIEQWEKRLIHQEKKLNIVEMDEKQLNKQLSLGNLDVAVGLPLTDGILEDALWGSKPVKYRNFDFYVRHADTRKLHKYIFFTSFKKAISQVGYVSTGEPGVINRALLEQSNFSDKLVPCGSLSICLSWLKSEKLDSIFADRNNIKNYFSQQVKSFENENKLNPFEWIKETKFGHRQPFSLLVNQRSLTEDEFDEINDLVR